MLCFWKRWPVAEPFRDKAKKWRVRLRARNGRKTFTSGESYSSHSNALRAARRTGLRVVESLPKG